MPRESKVERLERELKEARAEVRKEKAAAKKKETRKKSTSNQPAILLGWTESEAGWGQRPDGYSVHPTREALKDYISEYWAAERRRNPSGETPHEYTRPDGDRGTMIVISGELRTDLNRALKEGKHGVRIWNSEYHNMKADGQILSGDDL